MNFQIHFDIPFYLFVLFGAISAGLSYLMYRKLDGISRPRQAFLGTLRAVSIFLLLLAIENVVTDFVRIDLKKREVFVLLDDSKSMSLTDSTMRRPDVVRNILESAAFDKLGKYFTVRPVVFGGSVLQKANIDSLRYDQPATNLEAAVAHVSNAGREGETALALLLSDGEYNAGGNPIEAVRGLQFPVYTVGIGDSTAPKDVVVKQVIPAPSIYAGKKSVVKAIVSSNGYGGAYVTAYLYEDGRQVDSKGMTLPQYGNVEVSFNYTPETAGTHVLRVYVPPLSGEFSKHNNSASVRADVLKGKYSILLVAGEPATDAAFLRRNIESSGNFELKVLVQKNGDSFYEKDAASALSYKYDAVVLYDFPNAQSAATLREVTALLNSNRLPYVYFAGPGFSMAKVAELPRLPISAAGFEPGEFQVGISPAGSETLPAALQPVFSLIQTNSILFPPLYYQRIQCGPAAGAVVLASPIMNGIRLNTPAFVVDRTNQSAAFLTYGLWRLQLMSSLSGLRPDFLQDFITELMRTLISGGKQKLLTVHTDKEVYDPSESVNFNSLLVGQDGAPIDDAAVDLTIRDRQGRTAADVSLTPTGQGGYAGNVSGLGEGRYTYAAHAASGSTFLGADSGSVIVEPLNTEFIRTEMNAPLLRQIASVSGGQFFTPSQFINKGIDIKEAWKEPVRHSNSKRFELLSSLPILALVALLLAGEWTMRKIWGLP